VSTSNRFALTREGLKPRDIDLVDVILASYEAHGHVGGTRLRDPANPPTGVVATTGGQLAAGTTYFYRESWTDQFGLETAASPEFNFTTPAPVPVPSPPTLSAVTGGTLLSGPTYYALSAVAGAAETSLSNPAVVSIFQNRTVNVVVPPFAPGADHYHVWRQGPNEAGFTNIGTIADPAVVFADDGSVPGNQCPCDPSMLPPASNFTNSTSSVTITSGDPTTVGADPSAVKSWKLYRATSSGGYTSVSLLVQVQTTVNVDGTGGLLTSFVDDGSFALTQGQPLAVSQTLQPPPRVPMITVATYSTLPSPAGLDDGTVALVRDTRTVYATYNHAWIQYDAPPLVVPSFINLPNPPTGLLEGQFAVIEDTLELYVLLPALSPATGLTWQRVGGGPPALDNPVLFDPDHIPWSVDVDLDGHIITRAVVSIGIPYPLGRGPVFESAAGNFFRLGVEEGGGLLFYTATIDPSDTLYPDGRGPTFQATTQSAYRLGVDDDGMITLTDLPFVYAHTDSPVLVSPNGTHYRLVYDDPTVAYPTTEPVV
jgi:hypothetical protein